MGRRVKPVRFFPAAALAAFLTAIVISFLATGCEDIDMRFLIDDLTTKDPEWKYLEKITEPGGGDNGFFGTSVAIDGEYAVIGAEVSNSGKGAAYVYKLENGSWKYKQQLTAGDGAVNDGFGHAVAVSGSHIVVGAPYANTMTGAVYVFERSGETWSPITAEPNGKLVPINLTSGEEYGTSVAVYNGYVIAGSPSDDEAGPNRGSAHIFYKDQPTSDNWGEQTMSGASPVDGAYYGTSVSTTDDYAVVGAYRDDDGGLNECGAIYIFSRSGNFWTLHAKKIPDDAAGGNRFGNSVFIMGDSILAGNSAKDIVYSFWWNQSSWQQASTVSGSRISSGDRFGRSVSVSNDFVIVGADEYDNSNPDIGIVHIYEKQKNGDWFEINYFTASGPNQQDYFGKTVSISGNNAIVAIPNDDEIGNNAGAVYFYNRQ